MGIRNIPAGNRVPEEINVVVEIPMHGEPVKYEIDKSLETIFVDRILFTSMRYPCNYGYVPQTLADDGDPLDVLVVAPVPLITGSVIRCRPVGLFNMSDEHGEDVKILAVPMDDVCSLYRDVRNINDVPGALRAEIRHFFEHYKDLEPGKQVQVGDWSEVERAREEILHACAQYNG